MTDIARHSQAGISINGTVESAIVADSVSVSPQIQKAILNAGGSILPTLGATLTNAATIEFRTRNIDLITSPTALSSTGVIVAIRAFNDSGGHGSGYISIAIAKGLIVPVSLSASSGQPAELTCRVHGISSDGDTNPIAVGTTSAALSVHGAAHTVGDLNVGGEVGGIQSLNLDFGYQVKTNEGENGKTYPTLAYVDSISTSFTATTSDMSEATAARLNTAEAETSLSATFRAIQEGGVVTDTGKITVSMAKAIVDVNTQSGSTCTANFTITPIYDGEGDDFLTFS